MTDKAEPVPKVHYGYWIVAATFTFNFIQSGCGFYIFSLFVKSLETDLGWSRGSIMAAFTVSFLVMGVASPLVGRLLDRYGARVIIFLGAVMLGLGLVVLSIMTSLWHFYLGYIFIGIGMAAMGPVPTSAVVSHWFRKNRGIAIGIMSTGVGAGGFVLAPLTGGYLIPALGWRTAYFALALITWAASIPLVLLAIRSGGTMIRPDSPGNTETSRIRTAPAVGGLTLRIALATPAFWLITVSFLLCELSLSGAIQSQVLYLDDVGFPVATAAAALGVVGLISAGAKFGFGWLCDRVPPKYACAIGFALQLLGIIILVSIGPESHPGVLWLYAVIMGLGAGSWLPTMSMVVSASFGMAYYGSIFGLISMAERFGVAIGPMAAGYLYDAMHTYRGAFILFIILYLIIIPAILVLRRPRGVV